MMISNVLMKLNVVKIFRRATFACKCFCFDLCYANFFDFLTFDFLLFFETFLFDLH